MSPQLPDRRSGRPLPGGTGGPTPGGSPSSGDQSWRWVFALLIVAVIAVLFLPPLLQHKAVKDLPYTAFIHDVQHHQIQSVQINNVTGVITGNFKSAVFGGEGYTTNGGTPPPDADVATMRRDVPNFSYNPATSSWLGQWLPTILVLALFVGLFIWISRRAQGQMSGIMSIGRSRARLYTTERPRTTFADVAGYQGVKIEISEVVDFLKSPHRFRDIGAKIPKGMLLVGPPGTGKTLLARAVAGEAGVPFLSVSGSDFMEMFVGVGASRVRDLFQTARKQAPAIIFVDEIDSIGRKRGAGLGGGHDEREQTLNQMLSEMDGFDPAEGVVMIAATNRPDILDPALLRPGRFDRQIVVPLPDLEERLPILRVHCKDKRISQDVDLELVARGTPGMSGADLANLVNEAALNAARQNRKVVMMLDFELAKDKILMGAERKSMILSEAEKRNTAYHEAGHALVAAVLPNADPLHKVTIIPRGMALGVTMQLPIDDKHSYNKEYLLAQLAILMAGRIAEEKYMHHMTTGAGNDIERATDLARKMVCEWGMSELGPLSFGKKEEQIFLGREIAQHRDYSEETAIRIDEQVKKLVQGGYDT
ncbi:MAG TPA: ATP-dependent zinc metalloprotease FtsH, partial [Acidimicrobiales bacterium]|nr:ATP-dependent zinc metalloprotease FtsH [Acidimicrobiales bacterium]